MGLLSWLFRKPAFEQQPDRIFLTRSALLSDFVRQSQAALKTHDRVLLVTHFEKSRQDVLEQLNLAQISFEAATDRLRSHAVESQLRAATPTLLLADQLVVEETIIESHNKPLRIALLVAERHPLRGHDEHLE